MRAEKLIHSDLTYKVNGLLFDVRKELGRFRTEKQYCDAIENRLKEIGLEFKREMNLPPTFTGEAKNRNRIDFLIENKIILEVKAKSFITKNDYYQTMRYLLAINKKLALLVNMRNYYIRPKRVLNSKYQEGGSASSA